LIYINTAREHKGILSSPKRSMGGLEGVADRQYRKTREIRRFFSVMSQPFLTWYGFPEASEDKKGEEQSQKKNYNEKSAEDQDLGAP
jgi:hypothetical protein